jgi:translation initiation factor IF-2
MLSLAALLGLCVGGSAGWLVTYRPVLKTAQAEAPELAVAEAPDAVPAAVPEPDPAGLPTSLESAPAEAPPAEAPPADETRREPAPPEARRAPEVRFTAPPSEPVPPSPFLAADPFRPRQPVRVTLVYLSPTAHAVPSEETPEPAGE